MTPAERRQVFLTTLGGGAQALAPLLQPSPVKPSIGQVLATFGGGLAAGREQAEQSLAEQRYSRMQADYLTSKAEIARQGLEQEAEKERRRQAILEAMPPDMRRLVELGDVLPGPVFERLVPKPADPAKAPTTREFRQGASVVTQEWDPAAGAWKTVGQGPAWAPPEPREPPESWSIVTPEEARALGLPPGTYQRSSRGQIKPLSEGQAAATQGEREDRRLLGIKAAAEKGGWGAVSPEDRDWYEMAYRERAAPKTTLDPTTNLLTTITPDMSWLPLPPSMLPGGLPGGTAAPPPDATRGVAAPARGPQGGVTQVIQPGATREQLQKFDAAVRTYNDLTNETRRMGELLDQGGGWPAVAGERARKMEITAQMIVTQLGALSEAGVLQPSDIDRFTKMFGDPTSLWEAAKTAVGMGTLKAGLAEMERIVTDRLRARGTEAGVPWFKTEEEADAGVGKLPIGQRYFGPDGRLYEHTGES